MQNKLFPIYIFHNDCFHKVQNERDYLEVEMDGREYHISQKTHSRTVVNILLKDGQVITKEKFTEALQKVLSHINLALFMEVSEPACECDKREALTEDQINDLYERNEGYSEALNDLAQQNNY